MSMQVDAEIRVLLQQAQERHTTEMSQIGQIAANAEAMAAGEAQVAKYIEHVAQHAGQVYADEFRIQSEHLAAQRE